MPTQKLEFPGSLGAALAARPDLPDAPPRAFALFAHCFTCSKETWAATYIIRALVEADIAVLRFDFTGLGGSEGDFSNTNFSSNVEDLVAAAGWLRMHHTAPAILVGHSLGGAAVLAAAERIIAPTTSELQPTLSTPSANTLLASPTIPPRAAARSRRAR